MRQPPPWSRASSPLWLPAAFLPSSSTSSGSDMAGPPTNGKNHRPHITVSHLTMAFGSFVLMRDLNFTVNHGDVFIIMGGSGSGKSTLLRHMIGLIEPAKGDIFYGDENFTKAEPVKRQELLRRMGVLFQTGGLW